MSQHKQLRIFPSSSKRSAFQSGVSYDKDLGLKVYMDKKRSIQSYPSKKDGKEVEYSWSEGNKTFGTA